MKVLIERRILEEIEIEDEQIMTQKQAADKLGMTVAAVRAAMDRGKLTTVHLGRLRYTLRADIENWLNERETAEDQ